MDAMSDVVLGLLWVCLVVSIWLVWSEARE
jgi:hypothetical protein